MIIKIVYILTRLVGLLLLVQSLAYASGGIESAGAFKPHPLGEWEIHAFYGIGRAGGEELSLKTVQVAYPNATITLESRTTTDVLAAQSEYVVRRDGEVLFTVPSGSNLKTPAQTMEWDKNKRISKLYTANPKVRTKSGIGVGSTLAELRKAYSKDIYSIQTYSYHNDQPSITCVTPKTDLPVGTNNTTKIEHMLFYSESADKKPLPHTLKELEYLAGQDSFNPDTKVTAMATQIFQTCEDTFYQKYGVFKSYKLGEWEVHGKYGIGRIGGRNVTVGIMKEKYADATIAIQKIKNSSDGEYVVSRGEEVLFTTPCGCEFNKETNSWKGARDEDVIVQVYTANPKYSTNLGIGVGSTLGELRKAFPNELYEMSTVDTVSCLIPREMDIKSRDRVEFIEFDVKPAEGKTSVLLPKDPAQPEWYGADEDPDAKIIGMHIGYRCGPPH